MHNNFNLKLAKYVNISKLGPKLGQNVKKNVKI